MFIDLANIYVRSGKGGNGAIHFRREKFVPRGGPDGGNGGKGGDIVLEVFHKLNTLSSFRFKPKFIADDGGNGSKQNMTGRSGEDLVVQVPPGTVIYNDETGEVLGDLVEPGQRLVIAGGGRGGRGNARFATSVRQAPRVGERGEPGQEFDLRLELKLIADVGIIGVPNAGKSTLLAAVTNAKPKIASYPFTTLEPNLGVVRIDDETDLILADIPGLIEGAHQGIGLGHEFLRHIQRTRVLIHLLDGTAEDPLLDFAQINSELALFDPALGDKPQIVAFNKMDLPEVRARWLEFGEDFKRKAKVPGSGIVGDKDLFAISGLARTNIKELIFRAAQILEQLPDKQEVVEMPIYRVEIDPQDFTVEREGPGWRITGQAVERAAEMTYWEHFESVRRFQRILNTLGIEKTLRKAGIQPGETVYIGKYELEWED
jgi:GTP-binding protein